MKLVKGKYISAKDEDLMKSIGNGDTKAFNELYVRYSKKMHAFIFNMLNSDNEKSQDLLQDLFMKIIEKNHLFDTNKKFSSWLYSIAANLCKNEFRKSKPNVSIENHLNIGNDISGIDEIIDRKIFKKSLSKEIDKLDENHKMVFILRYNDNLSIKEVAEIMECSEGTVKSRLFYTLKKLSDKLEIFDPKK